MTTVLIYANADLEADLRATLFWREDLERYLAERADEARMLLFSTEPHVLVVDRTLAGADELIGALQSQSLPHPISIVALSHGGADSHDDQMESGPVDAVLPLPPGPEWDTRLVDVLQVPTRKQARFDVSLEVETRLRHKPTVHRGHTLNISAGGILVDCHGLGFEPGDDVSLTLQIPGAGDPVEGRARVMRQPLEERLGLRFEAFSRNGDSRVRDFLARLASPPRP